MSHFNLKFELSRVLVQRTTRTQKLAKHKLHPSEKKAELQICETPRKLGN